MRIRIKKKNVARLASLSALGAGAMALGTGAAEASVVEVSVNQTIDVTFMSGFSFGPPPALDRITQTGGPILVSLPGGAGFSFKATHTTRKALPSHSTYVHHWNVGVQRQGGLVFAPFSPLGTAFAKGQTWPASPPPGTRFFAYRGIFHTITLSPFPVTSTRNSPFNDAHPYFLFRFPDAGKTLYGWGQVTVTTNLLSSPGTPCFPPVSSGPGQACEIQTTFVDYAYDTTGARLPAGLTSPVVPEPSETVPLALSALVLGAAGIRRWRAAKPE